MLQWDKRLCMVCDRVSLYSLEKTILGVDDGLWTFFIFIVDKLRTCWRCFLRVDLVAPPPAKPWAMTLIVLVIVSVSSQSSRFLSSFEILRAWGFLLSSSLIGDTLLFLGLCSEAIDSSAELG